MNMLNDTLTHQVEIYHIPSKKSVKFAAYIEEFSDKYSQEWESDISFGRNDPNLTFKSTGRTISLSFKVPAESVEESIENQRKMSLLAQMQYPVYNSSGRQNNATTIQGSPLFKVKFVNWIHDSSKGASYNATAETAGLVCKISGVDFTPNIEAGFIINSREVGDTGQDEIIGQIPVGDLYAKEFTLKFEMTILHTHALGWSRGKKNLKFRSSGNQSFPYGVNDIVDPTLVVNSSKIIESAESTRDPYEGAVGFTPNQDVNTVKTALMTEGE